MDQNKNDEITEKEIFGRYIPEKKLGEGSFGKIFVARKKGTEERYAIKMETKDEGQSLLETESFILCHLKGFGIPVVQSFGYSGDFNVLIMELLGKSLENLFQLQRRKFSLKTTCMLGIQMIERIEWIHSKNIVHRDIKPDNFVMGRDDKSHIVYILDFGLSKKYYSNKTKQHIKFKINKKLTGTARYASVNALRGCEQSRRDDLEAIGYVLVYFLKGFLPWQGLKIEKNNDKYKRIYEKKKITTPEELCEGIPNEFVEYIKYTRNLEFEARPDYEFLKGLLKNIMAKNNYEYDFFFDWFKEKPQIKKELLPPKINYGYTEEDSEQEEDNEKKAPESSRKNNETTEATQTHNALSPEDKTKESPKRKKEDKEKCIIV